MSWKQYLSDFTCLMKSIGFGLIMYKADVDERQITELPQDRPLVTFLPEAMEQYSGCMFGGQFFYWIFPGTDIEVDQLYPNNIYHGYMDGDYDCHYFLVITTDKQAVVFNVYGGIHKFLIATHDLAKANKMLNEIRASSVPAMEEFFGYKSLNAENNVLSVTLTQAENRFLSKAEVLAKIDELISKSRFELDKEAIRILRSHVDDKCQ